VSWVDELREEADRIQAELAVAEREWQEWAIARSRAGRAAVDDAQRLHLVKGGRPPGDAGLVGKRGDRPPHVLVVVDEYGTLPDARITLIDEQRGRTPLTWSAQA
jgi:hypothetical protein